MRENSAPNSQPEVSEKPDSRREARTDGVSDVRPTANSYFVSSSERRVPVTHITSLNSVSSQTADERITLNAANPIRDYAMYFNGSRFYLVIPHARLDVIQDGLRGRAFSEPLVEKRGDDLVLSFVLLPGTKASVVERSGGLELLLMPTSIN